MTSKQSPSSVATSKSVTSWKPMGTTRLVFSSSMNDTPSHGSLECSLSTATTSDIMESSSAPKTLVSKRIVPCPRHHDDAFLLQSHEDTAKDESLHMGTINALLLSLKSVMLFQDGEDSSRHFVYAPRSLHTASLAEYNQQTRPKASPPTKSKKKQKAVESPMVVAAEAEKEITTSPVANELEQETLPTMEAVSPSELKKLYEQCLETGVPKPRDYCQQVKVSLKQDNMSLLRDLLVTFAQLQMEGSDNRRLLEIQIGLRLTMMTRTKFLKLHHEIVYKSAPTKRLRKKFKHSTPKKVLEEQVMNLLSLLAIRCGSPSDFRSLVEQLCLGVSQDMVQLVHEYFELDDDEETNGEERVPAVTPLPKTLPERASPQNESILLSQQVKLEEERKAPMPSEISFLQKSVSLTASQSTRKNSLVPDQKRKYVGSHFGTRLSNVSTLFRQVKAPPPQVVTVKKVKHQQIKLEPRPTKKPRSISVQLAKKVVTETPAKRQYALQHHALSPIGGSDSQNARLVAQEALAASRRKL